MTTAPSITSPKETPAPPGSANDQATSTTKPPYPLAAETRPINVANLSDEVLAILATAVPQEIAARQARREAAFFELVREQAQSLRVSPARLAAALSGRSTARVGTNDGTDGRSTVKPKFRNPKNPSETWAGRGKPPKWYTDYLETGGTEEAMRIPEGAV